VLDGSMVSRTTCKVKLGLTAPCDSLDGPFSCAAGSICLPGGPGAQTCGVLPAQGEACTDPGGDFACDSSTDFCAEASMTCVPKIAVGGACTSGYGCVPYAACDPTTLTCVAAGLAGAACDPQGSDCLGNLQCVAGACALPASRPTCP
jgi:hypothetical protein